MSETFISSEMSKNQRRRFAGQVVSAYVLQVWEKLDAYQTHAQQNGMTQQEAAFLIQSKRSELSARRPSVEERLEGRRIGLHLINHKPEWNSISFTGIKDEPDRSLMLERQRIANHIVYSRKCLGLFAGLDLGEGTISVTPVEDDPGFIATVRLFSPELTDRGTYRQLAAVSVLDNKANKQQP